MPRIPNAKNDIVHVSLPKLKAKIVRHAKRRHISLTEFVRRAVEAELGRK